MQIKTIIPTQNGFLIIPWDMNCMVGMKNAADVDKGVLVAKDADELGELVRDIYAPPELPEDS